ncbi:MAG: TonB-dependent receptor [Acidobacteria bacterium]|nr:TonB-dependent receptor [Acidobacteriota bacterium]MBV9624477.1 TonB-dependent receptor [Acidobacteriota bacterium]
MRRQLVPLAALLLSLPPTVSATMFGSLAGLIHDPQHRPIESANITLQAVDSSWSRSMKTSDSGQFRFESVPLGRYVVRIEAPGFAAHSEELTVSSGSETRLHLSLKVAVSGEAIEVRETLPGINLDSSSSTILVGRQQIAATPGAAESKSMSMITNYVPGAYIVHDQLHIRGGHQVSWLLDGVPVPNTSIASNVGPQFDPKDIDSMEIERGGYSAEYGDRTYGVLNVVTRSGFERNREAEFVSSYGSFHTTNDQISLGDHSERFAYYGSLSGYRTDLGLETPVPQVINDQGAGLSGFVSLIFNKDAANQLRLTSSARGDHYQVPVDPANPLADVDDERDDFVNFSWLHSAPGGIAVTVSPFYHFNRARYQGGPDDSIVSLYDRGSNYVGGVTTIAVTGSRHNFHTGLEALGEHDNQYYAVSTNPPGGAETLMPQRTTPWAHLAAAFVEDQFRATNWLTVNAGLRLTHYGGPVQENAADPRLGAAVRVPGLHWVVRAFYGRYYQGPPLVTVNNPMLATSACFAAGGGQCFLPLHGERDEQREFGLAVPVAGWTVDVSNFRTGARNFFDHDSLGNSNVFFPLTLAHARIRGWEATARSPRIDGRASLHFVYSHQFAEWSGAATGGLVGGASCDSLCFLDHDQRDTVSSGFELSLPSRISSNLTVNYGSGFLDGNGPAHLAAHTTFDLALAKSIGDRLVVRVTGLNLSNNHYMLDNSNTFGGTHFVDPRVISAQLTYRFRY